MNAFRLGQQLLQVTNLKLLYLKTKIYSKIFLFNKKAYI